MAVRFADVRADLPISIVGGDVVHRRGPKRDE
jgi:hypothetical protein